MKYPRIKFLYIQIKRLKYNSDPADFYLYWKCYLNDWETYILSKVRKDLPRNLL